ncbi:MAG TPA: hypothetical protein ENJ31_04490, partial [Anaerolineae bacterium]|nr:hypothetical protein [Anaerolineae bacterium]
MKIPASIAAILTLWPDLPEALGSDWPRCYWRLLDLLRRFEEAADEEARARISTHLLRELRDLPGGAEALRRIRQGELRLTRNGALTFSPPGDRLTGKRPDDEALAAQLTDLLHPPAVARYTDVYAPAQVAVGERFPLIVGLTRAPAEGGQETTAIQARLNQLIRVVLTPRGPELLGEPARDLRVREGDSEPVVFYLRTVQVGVQSVLIDFYSSSHLLTSLTHTLTAEKAGA